MVAWKREGGKVIVREFEISNGNYTEYTFENGTVTETLSRKKMFRQPELEIEHYAYTEKFGHYIFEPEEDLIMELLEIGGRFYNVMYKKK